MLDRNETNKMHTHIININSRSTMRFSVATAILVATCPSSSSSSFSFHEGSGSSSSDHLLLRNNNRLSSVIIPNTKANRLQRRRASRMQTLETFSLPRFRHHDPEGGGGLECDPNSQWNDADADIGVLSCGYHEYCAVDQTSYLGGRCCSSRGENADALRRIQEPEDGGDNNATAIYNVTADDQYLFDLLVEEFCYDTELASCSCSNVNATSYSGTGECLYPYECYYVYFESCAANISTCFSYTITVDLLGEGNYNRVDCFDQKVPEEMSICYYSTHPRYSQNSSAETCALTLNGRDCSSCVVVPTIYEVCSEDYYSNSTAALCVNATYACYHFDCTNVDGGWEGNDCAQPPYDLYAYACGPFDKNDDNATTELPSMTEPTEAPTQEDGTELPSMTEETEAPTEEIGSGVFDHALTHVAFGLSCFVSFMACQ